MCAIKYELKHKLVCVDVCYIQPNIIGSTDASSLLLAIAITAKMLYFA